MDFMATYGEVQPQQMSAEQREAREQLSFLIENYVGTGNESIKATFLSLAKNLTPAELGALEQDLNTYFRRPGNTSAEKTKILILKGVLSEIKNAKSSPIGISENNARPGYETNRSPEGFPQVIQIGFNTSDAYNSPMAEKNARMQDYENRGISYGYADGKGMEERFGKLSMVTEIAGDDSYREQQFNGILRNGESKQIRLRFGSNIDEFTVSYQQGILTFKATRAPFRGESATLINMSDIRHGRGLQKVLVGPGLDSRGFGYRAALFLRISGQ